MSAVAPSENLVQQEAIQFNGPVSEASATSIAALANAMREIMLPVGSIIYSMLTEAQFQAQNTSPSPERWILADGSSVVGSKYATVTGNSTVPDLRGVMVRGKNGARGAGTGNPDGDLALGTYTADRNKSHTHTDAGHTHGVTQTAHAHTIGAGIFGMSGGSGAILSAADANPDTALYDTRTSNATISINTGNASINADGGVDAAPRNVTLNCFIRIN